MWRDAAGEARAATAYRSTATGSATGRPGKLTVEHARRRRRSGRASSCCATSPRSTGRRAVEVWLRPIDEAAPLALVDGRAAHLADRSDHVWVRVVDVPAALTARTYAGEGSLVLEVADPLGYGTGRFRLDGGARRRHVHARRPTTPTSPCRSAPSAPPTSAAPGGRRLAAAGWVDEHRAGAIDRAAALFTDAPRAVVRDDVLSAGRWPTAVGPAAGQMTRSLPPSTAIWAPVVRAKVGPHSATTRLGHVRRGHLGAEHVARAGTARASGRSRPPARR